MGKSWNINIKTLKKDVSKMQAHINKLEAANNRLDQKLNELFPYLKTPDAKTKVYTKYGNYIANNQKWLAAYKKLNTAITNTRVIKRK